MRVSDESAEQNDTKRDTSKVNSIDAKIAALLIENPSATDQEIAIQVGISRQALNRRKNSPGVQNLLRSALSIPEKEMRRLTSKALKRLEELLDHQDPRIKLAASMALVKLTAHLTTRDVDFGLWWSDT